MAFLQHDFAARMVREPRAAAREILRRYQEAKCSQKQVALDMGCSEPTIIRWIKVLNEKGTGIRARMVEMRKRALREGWHHNEGRKGGRPARLEKRFSKEAR